MRDAFDLETHQYRYAIATPKEKKILYCRTARRPEEQDKTEITTELLPRWLHPRQDSHPGNEVLLFVLFPPPPSEVRTRNSVNNVVIDKKFCKTS